MLTVTLPWPPSVNHMYFNMRGTNKRIRTAEAKHYEQTVAVLVREAIAKGGFPVSGSVRIEVVFVPKDRRYRDSNNYLKSLYDSLARAGAFVNDNDIISEAIYKAEPDKANPRVIVKITPTLMNMHELKKMFGMK